MSALAISAALAFGGTIGSATAAQAAPPDAQPAQQVGYCGIIEYVGGPWPDPFWGAGVLCTGPGYAQLAGFCGTTLALSTRHLAPGEWVYLEIACFNAPLDPWSVYATVTPWV